ncbi:MAG: cupin domain-containing protein [Dehalococcoidia bacterium]
MPEDLKAFVEPTGEKSRAGLKTWKIPKTPYDIFMAEEDIPVYRGFGVYDAREIPRTPWKRMGGLGSFIQLDGTDGKLGMYVLEVPARGETNVERHMYDETLYVLEGRGTTEVWSEGSSRKHTFEWGPGSLFGIPINTNHRMINVSSGPAVFIGGTTAPPIFNLFDNNEFIFNSDFSFIDRFDDSDDYFKPKDDLRADPLRSRAMRATNLIPDMATCELPLDNQRSPGYRRVIPHMANGKFRMFVGEHQSGRYSMAHHPPAPGSVVLICIRGQGYTMAWPRDAGMRPFEAGNGEMVERQDYGPGGMVVNNPGGTGWFHMHHGIGQDPLRLMVYGGTPEGVGAQTKRAGDEDISGNIPLDEGGRSIPYNLEDPYIREEYKRMLDKGGVEFQMPEWVYTERIPTGHELEKLGI